MNEIKTILFDNDIVEIHKNPNLTVRPYLIRLSGWNNHYEIRMSKIELKGLVEILNNCLIDEKNFLSLPLDLDDTDDTMIESTKSVENN